MDIESIGLKPSPPLRYRFSSNISCIERFINVKERLVIEVLAYLGKLDVPILLSMRDSLAIFDMLMSWPHYCGIQKLYDMNLDDIEINSIDSKETIKGVDSLIMEYARIAYSYIPDEVPLETIFIPDKDKVLAYPNLRSIIEQLEKEGSDPRIKMAIAVLYIATDQEDKALEIYGSKDSLEAYECYNIGVIYLIKQNNIQSAKEQFLRIPELKEAKYNLGLIYLIEENWKQAFEYFAQLAESFDIENIDLFPSENEIELDHFIKQYSCNNLGVCHYYNDRFKDAILCFDIAISWGQVTNLNDGKSNKQRLLEIQTDLIEPPRQESDLSSFHGMIGKSSIMRSIYEIIKKVAPKNIKILIIGESGTGKDMVAKAIHNLSGKPDDKYFYENCARFAENIVEDQLFGHVKGAFTGATGETKGIIEQADGGTLFLDEIAEMKLELQAKLLRVIEDKEVKKVGSQSKPTNVDVRFIFATNKKLEDEVKAGRFREDLYHRINVKNIELPPLRERKEDIPLLIDFFLNEFRESLSKPDLNITPNALKLLEHYDWPGNIRELRNAIESSAIQSDGNVINRNDLPKSILNALSSSVVSSESVGKLTRLDIRKIRNEAGLSQAEFGKRLGLTREYINKLENGKRPVSKAIFDLIRNTFQPNTQ